jgi:hypothetical protein
MHSNSVARAVNLYVANDRGRLIVAAMHRNLEGIYYEQPQPVIIEKWPDPEELGKAFRAAFDAFSVRDANLRERKSSDWPSLQVSGLRSIKEFERVFRLVSCMACNSSNAVFRASIPHPTTPDVDLSVAFNPLSPPDSVGERLMRLIDATIPD